MLHEVPLVVAGALLLASSQSIADSHEERPAGIDEDALVRRVAEEVMKELGKSDFLQQQIELGIQKYVAKQREAQARAQAERGRAAGRRAESVRRVSAERDHIYGNPDARISLIEYSDFECPYCKRFHPTAKQAVDAYEGKVNWVYRHFPLDFHNPLAQKEAEATECANEVGGNDGFWRYADALYERTRSNGQGFPIDGLVPLAGELGLDQARFAECFESARHARRVKEDLEEGKSIGISGTPGNVLLDNDTGRVRVVSGAVPLARLRAQIDALLSASR
jgi:protein-disulfide isomerase